MATALVGSPTSAGSSRAEQERQFSRDGGSSSSGLQQQADAGPPAETLQATREMCGYCFGRWWVFMCSGSCSLPWLLHTRD